MGAERHGYALGPDDGAPVLLLHGLTGSPWDLRPLADALAGAGFRVRAPLLAGHTDVEALTRSDRHAWYDAALRAWVRTCDGRRGLLIGFSMGSLLALRLAAERSDALAGLVVMGVPIEQPRWQVVGSQTMAWLRERSSWVRNHAGYYRKSRSDVRREIVASRRAALPAVPWTAVVELARLQAEVRERLAQVTAPTLLLHGAWDHVAPVEGSARVSQALGSSVVRRVVLPNSCHHITRDLDRELVCAQVLSFAAQLAALDRP